MRVRITEHINGELGPDRYSYYPGQVIVDHPHEADWLARHRAAVIDSPAEIAVIPPAQISRAVEPESATPLPPETRRRRR